MIVFVLYSNLFKKKRHLLVRTIEDFLAKSLKDVLLIFSLLFYTLDGFKVFVAASSLIGKKNLVIVLFNSL